MIQAILMQKKKNTTKLQCYRLPTFIQKQLLEINSTTIKALCIAVEDEGTKNKAIKILSLIPWLDICTFIEKLSFEARDEWWNAYRWSKHRSPRRVERDMFFRFTSNHRSQDHLIPEPFTEGFASTSKHSVGMSSVVHRPIEDADWL